MNFPSKHFVLQGDMDAAGFTILNLNLAGLSLDKNDVGLGNVDNTSDVNKPVSTAQQTAIFLREPAIAEGTTDQFLIGDKTWLDYGDLALQDGATTLQELSAIGLNATGSAYVAAKRNDWALSFAALAIQYYGASSAASILGLSAANAAELRFVNSTYSFILSTTTAPLVFGYNNIRRMRLMTGLNVGGDTDPGAGCIEAADTITADHFEGEDLDLSAGAAFGGNISVVGSATLQGAVTTTLGVTVGQNLAVGGNAVSTGFMLGRAAHLSDAACPNDSVFYSTDGSKLSYKDGAGVVHALY